MTPTPDTHVTVAECGCRFNLVTLSDVAGGIQFDLRVHQCPLHLHAKELREVCTELSDKFMDVMRLSPNVSHLLSSTVKKAVAALVLTAPKPTPTTKGPSHA